MTRALQVSVGTLVIYLLILFIRWCRVRPMSEDASRHAMLSAAALSGATIGGGYPILWVMARNAIDWFDRGSTTFTFAGHLPPGVDEDDLLVALLIGVLVLIGLAISEVGRACQ